MSVEKQYGTSSSQCDYVLERQLRALQPRTIVDFGAGAGKNGSIVRQVLGPEVTITAVEGFERSARMLSTQGIYDEVCHSLIQDWLADDRGAYDVAVFGDVLEHLPPREIRWVIRQSLRRFKHVIVICPLHDIFQEETYDNPLEMHRAYITEGFFDRCQLVEKHIVKDGAYTIMNVHLAADQDARPVWSKAARSAFHHGMLLLQPLSLARPAVTLLKRHAVKYKWLIGRTSA